MPDGTYTYAEADAIAQWMFSPEGLAAARAAKGFAERTGLRVTDSEVYAIVIAAHEGEVAARNQGKPGDPGGAAWDREAARRARHAARQPDQEESS